MRAVGEYGPDFVLSCHDSSMARLSRVQGRSEYVVVIFFLVAGSPGCTKELNGYRDLWPEFQKRQVGIIAVSPDPVHALANFFKENPLPFDLCSDADHGVAEQWGTFSERGQMRSTFILSNKNTILHIFPRANVNTNASEVLAIIDGIIQAEGGQVPASEPDAPAQAAQAAPAQAAPAQAAQAAPAQAAPAQAAPAPAQAPIAASPAQIAAPGGLAAGDVIATFARTSLQLLLQHVEAGGQIPPDVADLAGRLALLRYR